MVLEVVVIEQPNMPIISLDVYLAGGSTVATDQILPVHGRDYRLLDLPRH